MRKVLFLLSLLLCTLSGLAQTSRIEGIVVSADDGEPLIGATVTVTGTQKRVATDNAGKFLLTNISKSDKTITVTYVGMQSQTLKIEPNMTISLQSTTEMMDEIVVVAFGKQKREAFTGSATVVKADAIMKQQANDPIKALEGKVPGLTMLGSDNPISENTINIRGLSSINAGNNPLIVVDGQPYNGSWRDINPADVDNISVLRDAASNALYGARGANGVIMITTKSAQKGKTRVNADLKWGVATDAQVQYDIIDNPGEYYEAYYSALKNYYARGLGYSSAAAHLQANQVMIGTDSSLGGLGYILYSVPNGEALIGSNGKLNPNASLGNRVYSNGNYYTLVPDDWKKAGIRNGLRQEYNVNISGGGDRFSTYLSLGFMDQKGITYGSDLRRYTARLKADYNAFKWLKVGANAHYSHSKYNNLYGAFGDAYSIAPIYPLYLRDGYGNILQDERGNRYDYGDATIGFYRPQLKNTNNIQSDRLDTEGRSYNTFGINGYANIELPLGFRITLNAGVTEREYRTQIAYNPYYGYYSTVGGYVNSQHHRLISTNLQQLINWSRQFGHNNLDVLIGHEYNRESTTNLSGTKTNIAMFDQNKQLSGAIVNSSTSGGESLYNVEGFFGRVQYDYDSRIFASASYRRDASSRFHPNHRWGNFWSVGGAWILSKESWFPKTDLVNMLKIKASYGEQGNDNLSSSFYWTDYYTITNSNDKVAYTFNWKGNPDITWETTGSFNTGIEFELFNNRFSGQIEYYWRKTRDMLYFYSVPSSLGYSGYYDNIGDMVNQGVEFSLNITPVRTKDVTWDLTANFSVEKNRVTRLPDTSHRINLNGHWGYQSSYYFFGEGLPMYTWYIPQYTGPDESGQPTWKVINADGTESRTTVYDAATNVDCGTAMPTMYGGFGTSVSFFNFDISANFTFNVGGLKLDNAYAGLMSAPFASSYGGNIHRDALNGWSETNTNSWTPRWQFNDMYNGMVSDYYLTSANQLTFQNVQLGYTLPRSFTKKFYCNTLRVFFSVDNVAYWTARKGFDPRVSRTMNDSGTYAPTRTFTGGLKIQF